jgi:hypothetical protein
VQDSVIGVGSRMSGAAGSSGAVRVRARTGGIDVPRPRKGHPYGERMMHTARPIRLAMLGIAVFAGLSAAGDALGQPAPTRVAMVIGNAAYTLAPTLPACAASADLVAGRLKAAGFDVTKRLDATNGDMGAALMEFAEAVAIHPNAAAVVYFCGYAVNYQDRDFVLPVSAALRRPSDALTEGVLERVLGATAAGSTNAGPALVLLDLFGLPNGRAAVPTATLAQGSNNGRLAIAVTLDAEASGADAATPAATALGTIVGERDVKLPGLIAHLLSLMPNGGTSSIGQQEATADLMLIGEAPKPPARVPGREGAAAVPAPAPEQLPAVHAPAARGQPNPGPRELPAPSVAPAPPAPAETQLTPPTSPEAAPLAPAQVAPVPPPPPVPAPPKPATPPPPPAPAPSKPARQRPSSAVLERSPRTPVPLAKPSTTSQPNPTKNTAPIPHPSSHGDTEADQLNQQELVRHRSKPETPPFPWWQFWKR